jgi:acetolactate synthase-1/2/3 large subunit
VKIRLADYVANFLIDHGITDAFSVTGGGAMHLNDALGHKEGLHVTYNHHEQACAIAAEAYARIHNKIAALCVTTGPGGTNAITGVVGGWLDSIPMFVISGQVRYDTTARYAQMFTEGHPLRAVGDQEFDITRAVSCMCKYAVMIEDPKTIRYHLERAYHLAISGRPGPVWIDIPVNFQGSYIETDELPPYNESEDVSKMPAPVSNETVKLVVDLITQAKRPILYAGNGIRISGGHEQFYQAVGKLGIPVCTCWDSIDAIETEHPLYCGRGGNMGDRPGNFAVQKSDLILAVGNRLSIRQVGYNWTEWAPLAKVIMVDIDPAELKKPTIHVDYPICADAKDFFSALLKYLSGRSLPVFSGESWLKECRAWKENYPVVLPKHWEENGKYANVYAFIGQLSQYLPENSLTVVSNGSCCVVGSHGYTIQKGSRFIINSAIASMGYGLPAAIGACIASGNKPTICLEGDGSIQMNLQELQTVITNKLPIKLFIINNGGYHSIRQTQNNLFYDHSKVGIGPESGDLSFPDFSKLAWAYGYPYFKAASNSELAGAIDNTLNSECYAICEIIVSTDQNFEPKSATKRLQDGTLVSPPLEDLAPFLPRDELESIMKINNGN